MYLFFPCQLLSFPHLVQQKKGIGGNVGIVENVEYAARTWSIMHVFLAEFFLSPYVYSPKVSG